jgi:hypothetical protein
MVSNAYTGMSGTEAHKKGACQRGLVYSVSRSRAQERGCFNWADTRQSSDTSFFSGCLVGGGLYIFR